MLAIIQARTGSKRFRNKVFTKLYGQPIIHHVIKRLEKSKHISKVLVATSKNKDDDKLVNYLKKIRCNIYRGSLKNVAMRLCKAAQKNNKKYFLRISGDSPLIDPKLIDHAINLFKKKKYCNYDLITNIFPKKFLSGQSIEIINTKTLFSNLSKMNSYDLEHVTPFFYNNSKKFLIKNFKIKKKGNFSKLSIDTKKDLAYIKNKINKKNFKNFSIVR